MLTKIISGGQSGVDQAACAFGIATGGWIPLGFLTEDGPRHEFAELYGAVEMPTASYAERTRQNVRDSDATLWFGHTRSPGAKVTLKTLRAMSKAGLQIYPDGLSRPSHVAEWLRVNHYIKTLNIAGHRESKALGIGAKVEAFLTAHSHD